MKNLLLFAVLAGSSAVAQSTGNPCLVPAGAQVPDGCFPLTYKPADGGPAQTIFLPFTPGAPVPTAKGRGLARPAGVKIRELDLGVDASYLDPDYGHSVNIQTGIFVLYTANRFGAEVNGRYTAVARTGERENTVVAGPRFNLLNSRRLAVYAKASFGGGHFSGDPGNAAANARTYFVQEYGGGIDYHASKHFNVRVADGEYQRWSSFPPSGLTPLVFSSGLSLRF